MMSNATKTIAVAAGGILLASFVATPSAMAYPPGQNVQVSTSKGTYKAKSRVKVKISQIERGCTVTAKIVPGGDRDRFTADRTRAKVNLKAPRKPGKYKLKVRVGGSGCDRETASTRIVVVPKRVPGTG